MSNCYCVVWDDDERKGEDETQCRLIASSSRKAPRGPPGLMSPSDRRITINSIICLLNIQYILRNPAGDQTLDLLNQRQTCYHLSQRGELIYIYIYIIIWLLGNPEIYYCSYINPPLIPILSKIYPVSSITNHLPQIHFNIIISSVYRPP